MNPSGYRAILVNMRDKYYSDVTKYAKDVRDEVIIPVCKKHGLTYITGNGIFFFSKGNIDFRYQGDIEPCNSEVKRDLKPVFRLLEESVDLDKDYGLLGLMLTVYALRITNEF